MTSSITGILPAVERFILFPLLAGKIFRIRQYLSPLRVLLLLVYRKTSTNTGSLTLNLHFQPSSLLFTGLLVSALTFELLTPSHYIATVLKSHPTSPHVALADSPPLSIVNQTIFTMASITYFQVGALTGSPDLIRDFLFLLDFKNSFKVTQIFRC